MSTIVALIGPIEYWWDTEDDPDRFNSPQARAYREHRTALRDYLADAGYLVYSPWLAFFGPWDERAQKHNDWIIEICDVVVLMRPEGIPGKGTDHELVLAAALGKPVVWGEPLRPFQQVVDAIKRWEADRFVHLRD